ncbi:MAG: SPOR domain-containing protein, partial [Gammaproteobacteria bacterium]
AAGKSPEPVAAAAKPARVAAAPPRAATVPESSLNGWFVQVGSFGQEINASGLSERLKSAGYQSRLQKVAIGKGYAYRVLVGPASTRSAAEESAARLKSRLQLAGIVIEYP